MAYCSKCGQENPAEANFCSGCGYPMFNGTDGTMKERVKDWASEVEEAGERFGNGMDRRFNMKATDFDKAFGIAGPLVKSIISFIVLVMTAEILVFVGMDSDFADDLGHFLTENYLAFFLLMLLSSYSAYIDRQKADDYRYFGPFVTAVLVMFSLWFAFNIFAIIGDNFDIEILRWTADLMWVILPFIFVLMLLAGYADMITKQHAYRSSETNPQSVSPQASFYAPRPNPNKLHRSLNDRMIGGVCGGLRSTSTSTLSS
ncbi:MAG: zinc-ribbon domain-containing protein [Methanomassiliicoccales archaeon]|jgi:hypothetical protein